MRSLFVNVVLIPALLVELSDAFAVLPQQAGRVRWSASGSDAVERPVQTSPPPSFRPTRTPSVIPLFMGRAAAVRASTKAKTAAKKAKTNAIYGKKIIMAVKEGGSPDPNANRALADVIKAAVNKRDGKIAEPGSVLFMYDRKGKVEVKAELDEEELLEAAIEAGCDDMELAPGEEDGTTVIYTDPKEASLMVEAVKSLGIGGDEDAVKMSLVHVSKAPVEVSESDFEKNMEIIDALEELDDVDSVEHNMSN